MKIFNLSRGGGKTFRMLYASEFNNVPILCMNHTHKNFLMQTAKEYKLDIPTPITVSEFTNQNYQRTMNMKSRLAQKPNKILIDEFDFVVQELFRQQGYDILGATMTKEMK